MLYNIKKTCFGLSKILHHIYGRISYEENFVCGI